LDFCLQKAYSGGRQLADNYWFFCYSAEELLILWFVTVVVMVVVPVVAVTGQ